MSFATVGSATLAYRVQIDGCPVEAVIRPEMERVASAGVAARSDGLKLEGQKFKVTCDPISSKLTAGSLAVTIVDVDNAWSEVFGKSPTNTTWLTLNIDDNDTTVRVASTAGFAASGYIWIDSECIAYTSKHANGIDFLGCTRASLSEDTDAATYHYVTDGAGLRNPEVTDWPVLWEQRRVRVFRYDEGDSPTGDGTQCYLGMISTAPRFNGVAWTFGVDSIASILDQSVGADLNAPGYPRGIYYPPESPLAFQIIENATTVIGGAPALRALVNLTGFFETQQAFVESLNTTIATQQSGAGQLNLVTAIADGDFGWHMEVRTAAGGSAKAVIIRGGTSGGRVGGLLSKVDSSMGASDGGPQLVSGRAVDGSVTASTTYFYWPSPAEITGTVATVTHFSEATGVPGAGSVPRGIFSVGYETPTIYLGGGATLNSAISSILIEWPSLDGAGEDVSDVYSLADYDSASRKLEISGLDFTLGEPSGRRAFTNVSLPSIRFGLTIAPGVLFPSTYYFLRGINDLQQQYSPLGVVPQLREGDWDRVAWFAAAHRGQGPLVTQRGYSLFAPVSLGDVVRPELLLAQCFLSVNSTGQLVPKALRLPVGSEYSATAEIDQDTLLTDEALVLIESSGLGQVNTVVMKTGYDPQEDKYKGRTIQVRDVAAFGQSPAVRAVQILPKSGYNGPTITDEDAVRCASGIFGALAGPYQSVTLDAAMAAGVEAGDPIVFSNPHFPDDDGALGVTGKGCLTYSIEREAYSPRTTISGLTTPQKLGGYAPAFKITAADDLGGNQWEINGFETDFLPGGSTLEDFFAADDRVKVMEINATTATVVVGTVVSVSPDDMFVQFDGAWGGEASGSAWWILTIANSDDADLVDTQRRFCHIANAAGAIEYDGETATAFRFNA